MDPSWSECPYCQAENRAGQHSGSLDAEINSRSTQISGATNNRGGGSSSGGGRETSFMSDDSSNTEPPFRNVVAGAGDTRQIVGFLITYSRPLIPWGDPYPVRLGKNYIGAGKIGSAPGDPDCDVLVKEDRRMSAAHALILCRQGRSANELRFDLIDQQSSNGTYMNDELVPLSGITLPNYAQIETGDTKWTFIKIVP
jgi:hypothetical protein